jgi:hypothetical protein
MMEALNEYGRPFHQRATELVVPPLSPADAAEMLELSPADAFDAFLVSGGLPLILDEWPAGMTALDYVADAVTNPLSALLVSGERALAAEFPPSPRHASCSARSARVSGRTQGSRSPTCSAATDTGHAPDGSWSRWLGARGPRWTTAAPADIEAALVSAADFLGGLPGHAASARRRLVKRCAHRGTSSGRRTQVRLVAFPQIRDDVWSGTGSNCRPSAYKANPNGIWMSPAMAR